MKNFSPQENSLHTKRGEERWNEEIRGEEPLLYPIPRLPQGSRPSLEGKEIK
jgi:hypothetical protein